LHEHPDMFAGGRMTEAELNDFSERAEFVAMLVYYFDLFIKFPASGVPIDVSGSIPWRDIFRQPIRYPPPNDHPLRRIGKAPPTPPPPSEK
jgi:hypothetical protein